VSSTAFGNIGSLVTNDESLGDGKIGELGGTGASAAGMIVEHGRLVWVGSTANLPDADSRVDLGGRAVIPGFVDSHAHLIFAGDRAEEFSARMEGRA
jgi:imidazolonepropionase